MESADVVKLVEETWNNTIPERRIRQIKIARGMVPEVHHNLFDVLVDTKISQVQNNPEQVVLLLIHGIQTDGAWHKHVAAAMRDDENIYVHGLGYECVTAFQLAGPFRGTPIKKITREIRDLKKENQNAKLIVIAHSFGSYIVSRILAEETDIEFEKIILCGSIVPRDFRWDKHTKQMPAGSIINDVGTKDSYPILATCSSVGYGSSGRRGFQTARVKDRYFQYGHSDFFVPEKNHVETYWKPFIQRGEVAESAWDTEMPKLNLLTLMLSHPWLGRPLMIVMVILLIVGVRWLFF
ncbi:hypothetical protein BVY11_08675 [Pseudomonas amygdali pv. morsprunorum]|uniref:Ymc-like protein n=2 Tax=Pseudomonas syringae group genomosp. 2 TaxID=251698 RepID=A0A7Z6USE8_PSESH|nr:MULTISPECIES: hypothetical protein [Pseudomonas syringae group]PPS32728.1 hypothetical protein BVY11_08675 [Pseudomonas amygdali pv. morsprunorum]KPZ05050.1 Ymc-like protein [Pseudomonas amygdali pv. ulmi]KWS36828.1 hypothetical protein AL065_09775 [Pseudomonas amygdali pv. ulmi]PPS37251.1 hypothetical protein BVY12_09045 [Pseudomonas amygdali pv. morsprunorum]PYD24392.1 hypothetical protein DND58_28090 [Pseudomonas syringae pv. pisi]